MSAQNESYENSKDSLNYGIKLVQNTESNLSNYEHTRSNSGVRDDSTWYIDFAPFTLL